MDSWTITLIVLATLISLSILTGIASIVCRCGGDTMSAAAAAATVRTSRHVRSRHVQQSPEEDGREFDNVSTNTNTSRAIIRDDLEAATFAANSASSANSANSSQATIWPHFHFGHRENAGN